MRIPAREAQLDKEDRDLVTILGKIGYSPNWEWERRLDIDILSELGGKRDPSPIAIVEFEGVVEAGMARNWVNRCKLKRDLANWLRTSMSVRCAEQIRRAFCLGNLNVGVSVHELKRRGERVET